MPRQRPRAKRSWYCYRAREPGSCPSAIYPCLLMTAQHGASGKALTALEMLQ
jgi:hypothetical protein